MGSVLDNVLDEAKRRQRIILYHGTLEKCFTPIFGKGEDRHDYGKGFYMTQDINLAREWAVCLSNGENGYVHKYELDLSDLKILDFSEYNELNWLAELMKHGDASDSKRYKVLSKDFIKKYGIDTSDYDVIKGWRADASYFYIAKAFVRDEVDLDILEELLMIGGLGIQYCIKTPKAFEYLTEIKDELEEVPFDLYRVKYDSRDILARDKMKELINSDRNKVTKVFSTLL